jgi:hypothetical protein
MQKIWDVPWLLGIVSSPGHIIYQMFIGDYMRTCNKWNWCCKKKLFFLKSKRCDFDFLKFVFWVNLWQDLHELDFFWQGDISKVEFQKQCSRQDLPLFYPLPSPFFKPQLPNPKRTSNLNWKAFVSDKTLQIQKPIKTNPLINAYKLNTKTQFPFQNHWPQRLGLCIPCF